eukprot:7503089-Lingulodinium_polyedra.AAC.1
MGRPIAQADRAFSGADHVLCRVLHQASYLHHTLLGNATLGWRRPARRIIAQVRKATATGVHCDGQGEEEEEALSEQDATLLPG